MVKIGEVEVERRAALVSAKALEAYAMKMLQISEDKTERVSVRVMCKVESDDVMSIVTALREAAR